VPPVVSAIWLVSDVFEVSELPVEELLEPGVQPIMKRRMAPARTAASL
jgi:hypothetical protein